MLKKNQKGFLPKLTGTFEHTAQMANIISTARSKQRSVVITLLDLKIAIGVAHHNLISEVLNYHHVPTHTQCLNGSLCIDFHTPTITDSSNSLHQSGQRRSPMGLLKPLDVQPMFRYFYSLYL